MVTTTIRVDGLKAVIVPVPVTKARFEDKLRWQAYKLKVGLLDFQGGVRPQKGQL